MNDELGRSSSEVGAAPRAAARQFRVTGPDPGMDPEPSREQDTAMREVRDLPCTVYALLAQ